MCIIISTIELKTSLQRWNGIIVIDGKKRVWRKIIESQVGFYMNVCGTDINISVARSHCSSGCLASI